MLERLPVSQHADQLRITRIGGPDSLFLEAKVRLVQSTVTKDETTTMKLTAAPNRRHACGCSYDCGLERYTLGRGHLAYRL